MLNGGKEHLPTANILHVQKKITFKNGDDGSGFYRLIKTENTGLVELQNRWFLCFWRLLTRGFHTDRVGLSDGIPVNSEGQEG